MSSFYYGSQHHSTHSNLHNSHSHHAGRSRRATRASTAHHHQHHQKQMRALRLQKEAEEERAMLFRREFDAARSFDFEDDDLFCPFNLLTDDDLQSMSSGSDRSSLSSGSPDHSPITQQVQPAPTFLLPPSNFGTTFQPSNNSQNKIHQPLAQRIGAKAIPIVDPSTRTVASPPPSVSPGRQMMQAQQFMPRRAW